MKAFYKLSAPLDNLKLGELVTHLVTWYPRATWSFSPAKKQLAVTFPTEEMHDEATYDIHCELGIDPFYPGL